MNLDIRPLTPDMLDDYLYFFDNTAFADHPDWSQCYCIHFHWQPEWDGGPPKANRDRAAEHIRSGAIRGYLAYAGGKAAGWCNANDKYAYSGLVWRKEICADKDSDQKIKSVVCFLVAPELRGQGIATRLLERVCADAMTDGYDIIEGHPLSGECDMYAAHHGTISLFEKCGFAVYKRLENDAIMRKYLER